MSNPIHLPSNESKQYRLEVESSRKERSVGNLPRSRVYARRALAILLKVWMIQHRYSPSSNSSYDLTNLAISLPEISDQTKVLLGHFVQRVDMMYEFPPEIDLLDDLEQIFGSLNIMLSQET